MTLHTSYPALALARTTSPAPADEFSGLATVETLDGLVGLLLVEADLITDDFNLRQDGSLKRSVVSRNLQILLQLAMLPFQHSNPRSVKGRVLFGERYGLLAIDKVEDASDHAITIRLCIRLNADELVLGTCKLTANLLGLERDFQTGIGQDKDSFAVVVMKNGLAREDAIGSRVALLDALDLRIIHFAKSVVLAKLCQE
jgi:hypothetical protein